jgi:cell division septation protein DedD
MMAPEKLKPEDIDSAMAATAQHVRARRPEDEAAASSEPQAFGRSEPQQTDWLEERTYEADIPPFPEETELRADDEPIGSSYDVRPAPRRTLPVVAGGVALLVIAGLVWWMFRPDTPTVEEIPVVAAEPGEVKTRPEEEGGMEVPNRDISVYEQIGSQPESSQPEVVMPAPETPIPPAGSEMVTTEPAAGPDEAADRAQSEIDAVLRQLEASAAASGAVPQPAPETQATGAAETTQPAAETAAQPAAEQPQVAAAPAAEPAAVTTTQPSSASGVRIQLAAFKSEDQARGAWSGMQQRFPNELGGLPLIIEQADLGAKGIFYRVQTGPLASREVASAMCDRLKVQGQTCIVAQ